MKGFQSIRPEELTGNPFEMIGTRWMLIGAGNKEQHNMMTASWGTFGVLWFKPVVTVYVRPSRHTYGLLETNTLFTLSFFPETYREALNFCGSFSGRDVDKTRDCKLTALETDNGTICFAESDLIIECRKIYFHDLVPANFLDDGIEKNYHGSDYHRVYYGEITGIYRK
ncbi:MAG: flavin reductase [Spirochaetes bacterium GWF1_51_8]|nr:MAG: flavin reductase [Spirochaetes bacterium GWF1_51_8]